jgi:hypothetical protein
MSEELKRKLHDYEEIPSEMMWNKIAVALDEEIIAGFPQKLYEAEINPPANAWNKIAVALEQDIEDEYPAKLYNLEVAPPAGTWQKISTSLEEEKTLPRIPLKRRIVPFIRYAAAACIIGIVALGAFMLLNRKASDHAIANKTILPQNTTPSIVQPGSQKNSSAQVIAVPDNNLPKERTALAKINTGLKRRFSTEPAGYMTQMIDPSAIAANAASTSNFQQASLSGNIPGSRSLVSDADRYLTFMNPDGYLIRMSKKLAEALGCFYTNGNSEEYKQCQEQIRKWRERIAQSSATSSPDNFMDILDIIKSVQDKEL